MKLHDARTALEAMYGTPAAVVSLRHGGAQPPAPVPTELDVLVFREDDPDEPFTFLATAGASAVPMRGPIERAELLMRIDGALPLAELEAIARGLGGVAIGPFLEGFGLHPDLILDDLALPRFTGMTSAMIGDWNGDGDEWLRGVDEPVRLLDLVPLFPSEVDTVRAIGVAEARYRFVLEGVNPHDPTRRPAALDQTGGDDDDDDLDDDT